MKQLRSFIPLFVLLLLGACLNVQAQRQYHTNKAIAGSTEDSQGTNYMLLHKIYDGTFLQDHFVQGKITGIRGSAGAFNRKWTVEVNTSSARDQTRGSILCYNEAATLVTLTYNAERYLAVSITNSYLLNNFSFTGYAQNEALTIVYDQAVTDVQPFIGIDAITIQGSVGIGTTYTGIHKLAVEGSIGARRVKVNQTGWADFVFDPEYKLPSLSEVERYIKDHQHLPEIPSAGEVEKDGLDLGEMNKKLLQKIEELTLYIIKLQKQVDQLENKVTPTSASQESNRR